MIDIYFEKCSGGHIWRSATGNYGTFLLIENDEKELRDRAGLSQYTTLMLSCGENGTTETPGKICKAPGCTVDDIVEFIYGTKY